MSEICVLKLLYYILLKSKFNTKSEIYVLIVLYHLLLKNKTQYKECCEIFQTVPRLIPIEQTLTAKEVQLFRTSQVKLRVFVCILQNMDGIKRLQAR